MSRACVTIEPQAKKIQTYTSTMWNWLLLFPYSTHARTHPLCGFYCCCFPIRVLSSAFNFFRFPSLFLSASVFVWLKIASFVRTIGCHGDSLATHKTVSMEHTRTHTCRLYFSSHCVALLTIEGECGSTVNACN